MSAGAAGDGLGLFHGCISASDMGIQRRPYHKNCKCALHKERGHGGHCSHTSPPYNKVSYPTRKTWSDSCLSLMNLPSQSAITHIVLSKEKDKD